MGEIRSNGIFPIAFGAGGQLTPGGHAVGDSLNLSVNNNFPVVPFSFIFNL